MHEENIKDISNFKLFLKLLKKGSLINLAEHYQSTGQYSEAESLYKRGIEIQKKANGEDHPKFAGSLNNLAVFYRETGRYSEAEPLYKRAIEIKKKAFGEDHPKVEISLNNLAVLYLETGRYSEAEPLFQKSLKISVKALGEDHPGVATNLNNLAELYKATGRYSEAEPLIQRSIQIDKKALGENHPGFATNLNNLAGLYLSTGRYSEAESLYQKGLDIKMNALGEKHLEVATAKNNLAHFYDSTGRYSEAESLYKSSLEINKQALGEDNPLLALTFHNLALVYQSTKRYTEAESLFLKALEIRKKALSEDHPEIAANIHCLALLYQITERSPEAEPLYQKALEINETTLGKYHPAVARNLIGMALVYQSTGRYSEVEPLIQRALKIVMKALGEDHPDVAEILGHLAMLNIKKERPNDAHLYFKKASEMKNKFVQDVLTLLSEKQKMEYVSKLEIEVNLFLSHTVQYMINDPNACRHSFDAWLRWKGSVMEAQSKYLESLFYVKDLNEVADFYRKLMEIKKEITYLTFSGLGKMTSEEYKKRLSVLDAQKDSLEVEMIRLNKDYSMEKKIEKADCKTISNILPKGSFLIDFSKQDIYDFKVDKWQPPHYLAFLLSSDIEKKHVKLIDLGESDVIDGYINDYRNEMKRVLELYRRDWRLEEERLTEISKRLYIKVFEPIIKYIGNSKHIFLSPDGNLNLLPFDIFITPEGKYLIEEYQLNYISAGRDFVRFQGERVKGKEIVIMANPDFDLGLERKEDIVRKLEIKGKKDMSKSASRGVHGFDFKRLEETKYEAEAISQILRKQYNIQPRIYLDDEAIEEVLYTLRNPKIIHIATHGFFLSDLEIKSIMLHKKSSNSMKALQNPEERLRDLFGQEVQNITIENPMLNSGIALAGANTSIREGRDDGIITAEKITGLMFRGTELVVLSACDSGLGEVKVGEGVFGLKRAFILAGAETLVLSLWHVPDKTTKDLMIEFYKIMGEGKGKAEALRKAKLNIMKDKTHPYFWGAFIAIGNPN